MAQEKRTVSNLIPSTRYIARVRAFNGLGTPSAWSEALIFTTGPPQNTGNGGGDSSIPGAPSTLHIDYSSSTLIVTWVANGFNVDATPLIDLLKYEITLTANSISVTYNSFTPSFSYSYDSNKTDFGTVQNIIQVSVRAVDLNGNRSAPLTGTATNGVPTDSPTAPDLSAAFTIISITMHTNNNADWGGYVLHHSTNGSSYSLLATLTDADTYMHQVTAGTIHYYKYKIMDKFGNVSTNFSPAANITTHSALVVDNAEVIDNLFIKSSLVVKDSGYIESFNYSGSAGYHMTASKLTIQNGGVEILGLGGFLSMDSTSLRAVYSSNTQLLVNSSGVFIGGNDSTSAEIYVDTAAQKTYIQGATIFQSSGGNYTFTVDLSNQTTGSKVLRLKDSGGTDTFYLTNDGEGYFAKGAINLGGSSALHVDNSGNLWLGNSSFGSAPFRVSAAGALTATSGTFTGAITGSTITGSAFKTAISGKRIEMDSSFNDEIRFYSGHASETTFGLIIVDSSGSLTIQAPQISGTASGFLQMQPDHVYFGLGADISISTTTVSVFKHLVLGSGVILKGNLDGTSAPAIQDRGGDNVISFDWDGTDCHLYIDATDVGKITLH